MNRLRSALPRLFLLVFLASTLGSCCVYETCLVHPQVERHIQILASDEYGGREAGTEDDRRTIDYIRNEMEGAGLVTELQEFTFVAGTSLPPGSELALGERALADEEFIPLSFSGEGAGKASAVFVGYGISAPDLGHDDYAGIDVKDRVVVALAGSPDGTNPHGKFGAHSSARSRALTAAGKGAAALVMITRPPVQHGPHSYGGLPPFEGKGRSSGVVIPALAMLPGPAAEALGLDPDALRQKLDAHENVSRDLGVEIRYRSTVVTESLPTANVLGWLEAGHPDALDEVLIIGAHHDHLGRGGPGSRTPDRQGEIHNGADDNASGVAAVLEAARLLAPSRRSLQRHVLFMTFGAEEKGLLGSKYFKENPLHSIPREDGSRGPALDPIAMINLDMVGRMEDDLLLVNGAATSSSWKDRLMRVRDEGLHEIELRIDDQKDLLGSSDHTPFYDLGMPILFLFTGSHPEYHTPEDDLYREGRHGYFETLINLDGLSRITVFLKHLAWDLTTSEDRPDLVEGIQLSPQMSFRVKLSLMPDYSPHEHGMRVEKVTAGGPAESGGMRDGDIITRFGDTPVKSVMDYMVGLQKAKAGEPVRVRVKRGDEEIELTVTPVGLSR